VVRAHSRSSIDGEGTQTGPRGTQFQILIPLSRGDAL
jgi:hypothetical protein